MVFYKRKFCITALSLLLENVTSSLQNDLPDSISFLLLWVKLRFITHFFYLKGKKNILTEEQHLQTPAKANIWPWFALFWEAGWGSGWCSSRLCRLRVCKRPSPSCSASHAFSLSPFLPSPPGLWDSEITSHTGASSERKSSSWAVANSGWRPRELCPALLQPLRPQQGLCYLVCYWPFIGVFWWFCSLIPGRLVSQGLKC